MPTLVACLRRLIEGMWPRRVPTRFGPGTRLRRPKNQWNQGPLATPQAEMCPRTANSGQVLPGSSPITDPRLRRKRTRSQGPSLRRHYPASPVLRPCPTPAGIAVRDGGEGATLMPGGSPQLPAPPFRRAVPTTPVDRGGCVRRLLPRRVQPSPKFRRVGVHDFTFEACSGFTHVTARRIARPPEAAFVTRLRPAWSPGRAARQLPDQPTTLWVEPSSTGGARHLGALKPSGGLMPA